jgi:hypothetical protein
MYNNNELKEIIIHKSIDIKKENFYLDKNYSIKNLFNINIFNFIKKKKDDLESIIIIK